MNGCGERPLYGKKTIAVFDLDVYTAVSGLTDIDRLKVFCMLSHVATHQAADIGNMWAEIDE